MGEPAQVGERVLGERVEQRRRDRDDRAGGDGQHAEPHHRRHRRHREEVGGKRDDRDPLEMEGEQRRRAEARGRGERRRLRQRCRHRARAQREGDRRGEEEDRDHRRERQLPPGVAGGPRIEPERDRGGEQQRVPARGRAAGEDGDYSGGAHDAGPLDRGPGARERDVQRDQHETPGETCPQAGSERGEDRKAERDEQHHVLAARGEQMGEPGDPEVLARGLVERLVLAEDHPPRQGGAWRVEAAADRALGRVAHRIERPWHAAAPAPGGRHALGEEPPVRAAAAQPAVAVAQRQQAAPRHHLLPHVHARPAGRAHDYALPRPAAAREPDERGPCRAPADRARPLQHVAARRGLFPISGRSAVRSSAASRTSANHAPKSTAPTARSARPRRAPARATGAPARSPASPAAASAAAGAGAASIPATSEARTR